MEYRQKADPEWDRMIEEIVIAHPHIGSWTEITSSGKRIFRYSDIQEKADLIARIKRGVTWLQDKQASGESQTNPDLYIRGLKRYEELEQEYTQRFGENPPL